MVIHHLRLLLELLYVVIHSNLVLRDLLAIQNSAHQRIKLLIVLFQLTLTVLKR